MDVGNAHNFCKFKRPFSAVSAIYCSVTVSIGAAFNGTTWPMMNLIFVFQVVPLIAGLLVMHYGGITHES